MYFSPCKPLTGICIATSLAFYGIPNGAGAVGMDVSARIVESTCSINVSSGTSGAVDLGDWSYVAAGGGWQLLPVGSGVGTGTANSMITVDPSCGASGMAGLMIKFPGTGAPKSAQMESAVGMTETSGPVFVLTSEDGQSTFPVWAAISAKSVHSEGSSGLYGMLCSVSAKMNGVSANSKLRWINSDSGWMFGVVVNSYTYVAIGSVGQGGIANGDWWKFTPTSKSSDVHGFDEQGKYLTSYRDVSGYTLAMGQAFGCRSGEFSQSTLAIKPVSGQLARNTSYNLRFSGPRSIPTNAWPTPPPAPGTQYRGVVTLTMTYL